MTRAHSVKSSDPSKNNFGNVGDHVVDMQATRIFVVGDLILDAYVTGRVQRISPEAPVPVLQEEKSWSVLGGAANVAANISAFGGDAWIAGRIGDDAYGQEFKSLCKTLGISTKGLVTVTDQPTTRKLRVLAGYQQIVRIDSESKSALRANEQASIIEAFEEFVKGGEAMGLVISDYGKGVVTPELCQELIRRASSHNIPVITDPKSIDLQRYKGSTVIKPNLSEGREVMRILQPSFQPKGFDEEVDHILDAVINLSGATYTVLSLSDKGVKVAGRSLAEPLTFSSTALQVADVSGAGDTMVSFIAMGLAAGLGISRSVLLANIAAGIVCTKLGTATVSASEFLASFKEETAETAPEKVMGREELSDLLSQAREAGKKVVFTNGCFDLLHVGHIDVLQKAKALGDILVVAVNSSASVSRLKGPSRPLQSEEDRAKILASLASVDYVTVFDEETPLEVIKLFKPQVIVKGGDYNASNIVGAAEVKSWGGEVVIVPLVEGRSTTKLVERSKS